MHLEEKGGINDTFRKFLVICKSHSAYPLKELLNICITSGVYRDISKISQITPIHKKGSPRDF